MESKQCWSSSVQHSMCSSWFVSHNYKQNLDNQRLLMQLMRRRLPFCNIEDVLQESLDCGSRQLTKTIFSMMSVAAEKKKACDFRTSWNHSAVAFTNQPNRTVVLWNWDQLSVKVSGLAVCAAPEYTGLFSHQLQRFALGTVVGLVWTKQCWCEDDLILMAHYLCKHQVVITKPQKQFLWKQFSVYFFTITMKKNSLTEMRVVFPDESFCQELDSERCNTWLMVTERRIRGNMQSKQSVMLLSGPCDSEVFLKNDPHPS